MPCGRTVESVTPLRKVKFRRRERKLEAVVIENHRTFFSEVVGKLFVEITGISPKFAKTKKSRKSKVIGSMQGGAKELILTRTRKKLK